MVAHILYTEPRDDDDDQEYANPYPNPDDPQHLIPTKTHEPRVQHGLQSSTLPAQAGL